MSIREPVLLIAPPEFCITRIYHVPADAAVTIAEHPKDVSVPFAAATLTRADATTGVLPVDDGTTIIVRYPVALLANEHQAVMR